MNKENIKSVIGFLVIGLLLGYIINPFISGENSGSRHEKCLNGQCEMKNNKPGQHDMHMMEDGQMMKNMNMSMHSMMNGMMQNLQGKTGDEFDRAFLEEMIVHHEGAVLMAREVLKSSNRAELKNPANEIITAQEKEISMMKGWLFEWFR